MSITPRIVYMGTPDFAVEPLRAIKDNGYNVVAVVTAPDRPAGRGLKTQPTAVKTFALEHSLPVLQPERLKDEHFTRQLEYLKPEIGVVVAFRMLPKSVWSIPRLGTFNLHASLLPQYRGAAPINWAIINGEKTTGVTTFLLDEQLDTGNILLQKEVCIGEDETAGELHDRLMLAGADLVVKTLDMLLSGHQVNTIPQHQLMVAQPPLRTAPKLFRETCRIRWNDSVSNVYNLIRGLSPYPTAWSEMLVSINGKELLLQVKIYSAAKSVEPTSNLQPGSIDTSSSRTLRVACSDGFIALKIIQQAGKKAMPVEEFVKGWHNTKFIKML